MISSSGISSIFPLLDKSRKVSRMSGRGKEARGRCRAPQDTLLATPLEAGEMKSLRLGIGMLLIGLALLGGAETAAAGACDQLRKTDEEIRVLAAALQDIEKKEQGLAKALEQAKLNDNQEREKRKARIDALTSRRSGIVAEVDKFEAELITTQARLDPQQLQVTVNAAEQQLWAVQQELANTRAEIESLEKEMKRIDEQVSRTRSEYEKKKQEFDSLFAGVPPNRVLDALAAGGRNPVLEKTMLEDIRRALGRKNIYYGDKEGAVDADIGTKLDELSEQKLKEMEAEERQKLKELANRVIDLQSAITREEEQLQLPQKKARLAQLRAQLTDLQGKEKAEEGKLNEARRTRQAAPTEADKKKVRETKEKLDKERKKLTQLEQELREAEGMPSPLKAAEADYNRVRSERIKVENDLKLLKERRADLQRSLDLVRNSLSSLTKVGRTQGREAIRWGKEGEPAKCQESLVAAESAFKEALALAKENQGCLDVSGISTLEKDLQTLRKKAQCGGGSRQSGLIEVPVVKKGTSQAAAERLLEGKGFKNIQFVEVYAPSKPEEAGRVVGVSSPTPGRMVPPETVIMVSTFNNPPPDPERAADEQSAARAPGGGWDAEADKARVTAVTRSQPTPAVPTGGSAPPRTSSQVDQANKVAEKATALGPQDKPFITPGAIMEGLATAAGIAAATKSDRGKTIGSTQSPPLTPIPSDPLPGIIPSAKTDGGKTIRSTQPQSLKPVPSTGTTGGRVATSGSGTATRVDGGAKSCPVHYSGVEGDAYYVIEYPGSPVGFEIRKTWDPPKGDADRLQCGSVRGAAKRCIEVSFKQMGSLTPVVLGPFTDPGSARRTADSRCR